MPKLAITIAGVGKLSLAPGLAPGLVSIHMSFWMGHRRMLRVPLAWHSTALHSSTAHQYDSKRLVVTATRTVAVSVMKRGMFSTLSRLSRSRNGLYLVRVKVRVSVRARVKAGIRVRA